MAMLTVAGARSPESVTASGTRRDAGRSGGSSDCRCLSAVLQTVGERLARGDLYAHDSGSGGDFAKSQNSVSVRTGLYRRGQGYRSSGDSSRSGHVTSHVIQGFPTIAGTIPAFPLNATWLTRSVGNSDAPARYAYPQRRRYGSA